MIDPCIYIGIYVEFRGKPTLSQPHHQPSRRRHQRAQHPRLGGAQRRGGGRLAAAGRRGAGGRDAGVDEVGPAHFVDERRGLDVVEVEGLGFVGGGGGVEGHSFGEAGVAGGQAARGQGDAEG